MKKSFLLLVAIVAMATVVWCQPRLTLQPPNEYTTWIPENVVITGTIDIENLSTSDINLIGAHIGENITNSNFPDGTTFGGPEFDNPSYFSAFWLAGIESYIIEFSPTACNLLFDEPGIEIPAGEILEFQFWATICGSEVAACTLQVRTEIISQGEEGLTWVACDGPKIIVNNNNLSIPPDNEVGRLQYALHPNYPNPFNPTTAISYQLPANSNVSLQVYDAAGRLVATLVNGWRSVGTQEVTFDGSGLSSGVYIYRLEAGDFNATGRMALLK